MQYKKASHTAPWLLPLPQACQSLLLALSAVSVVLVCEEDGTEVDSEEFFMALPDNTVLMTLEGGQTWKPIPVRQTRAGARLFTLRFRP
jgi:hypothetical protein